MDQFTRWSCVAHSLLSKHVPQIKLGQVHQLLAACLGHQTYASLRKADLETLNRGPSYVLFDIDAGFVRAAALGLPLTEAHWREVKIALSRSGVTPFWLIAMASMHLAARLTFEDADDARIHAMKRAIGFPNGQLATSSRCHSPEDGVPEILRFDVDGEVHAYDDEISVAIPVIAVVEFRKIGQRMYGKGSLVSVEQNGDPRAREDEEDIFEVFGMSED
ncbi:hypothetical protein [Burkholderia sp. BCC1999]|uniref:hypothetical protein n=1 Tax=Burkholderia sp. BCC1999 TaxID=2817448 RepID=UPI002AC333B5|nr:hypothetical protein [Burkholderia sp. BCC1999]